jgi:TonB-dependent SusC/RagA subfamily outer membrane receptor
MLRNQKMLYIKKSQVLQNKLIILIVLLTCFLLSGPVYAQKANKKRVITGMVTDINQKPVRGAIILVDSRNSNVVTNSKGFYRIKVKPDAVKITVITMGNAFYESEIEGRSVVNFTLENPSSGGITKNKPLESTKEIDVGYGTGTRENLTLPVSSVDIKKGNAVTYTDIYQMISGRVPGVQVVGHKITISGASSFTASTEPLFVVNGIVVQSIDDISPTEVKSIDILKGPAASIYGSRGANGVILINLK